MDSVERDKIEQPEIDARIDATKKAAEAYKVAQAAEAEERAVDADDPEYPPHRQELVGNRLVSGAELKASIEAKRPKTESDEERAERDRLSGNYRAAPPPVNRLRTKPEED